MEHAGWEGFYFYDQIFPLFSIPGRVAYTNGYPAKQSKKGKPIKRYSFISASGQLY